MPRHKKYGKDEILQEIVNKDLQNIPFFFYEETDSTNIQAKNFAKNHPGEKAVFVADRQTLGRGRLGRKFESFGGVGIYMSLVIPSEKDISSGITVTAEAAVKAARAIQKVSSADPKIKWVNDLYLSEKKLAGILTEGVISPSGEIVSYVVGIGINVYKRKFGKEIENIATSLEDEGFFVSSRSSLAAALIDLFYTPCERSEVLSEYRKRSYLTGKRVEVVGSGAPYAAEVLGITDDYHLIVKADGEERELFSGEVSVKPKNLK